MGDATCGPVRSSFNPQLRVEFRGATVTSDAGLLLPRELDERLELDALIERHLTGPRTGHNRQFPLADLFRQSIYSRLAGYEDTNDAERLAEDPTFRMLASRKRRETSVALTSTLHWFETVVLTEEQNYQGLARLNAALIQHAAARSANRRVTLDIDSSESPVHGAQEQSAYNGHFESVCYHPLFVFNSEGDCLAAKLRPGNVHSADGWDQVLLPIIDRYRARGQTVVVRADAAFALPALYEALEQRGVAFAIRLPADDVLERRIEDLLVRPRGRLSPAPLVRYRSFRLQPRQSPAPAGLALHHPELVADEPAAAAVQDRRAPHSPYPVLHPAAGRKPLDEDPLSADSRAHRATRLASDVIQRTARRTGGKRSEDAGSAARAPRARPASPIPNLQHGRRGAMALLASVRRRRN